MRFKYLLGAAVLASLLAGCNEEKAASVDAPAETPAEAPAVETVLETEQQKLSYLLGSTVAAQFKMDEIEIDQASFRLGLEDVLADAEPRMPQEEVMEIFGRFQEQQLEKQQAQQAAIEFAMAAAAEENRKAGEAFLAENAGKEGVVSLESGLQYKVITAGSGAQPAVDDQVEVHYRGSMVDGTVFESSYDMGETAKFVVNQVIPGWTEALLLMKEGAKWELYIPSNLAYGPTGAGQSIGPDSTLIFEVELLKVGLGEG